jgi:hypothetical protein
MVRRLTTSRATADAATAIGLHADVVHGPDADAHGECAEAEPGEPGESASGGDAAGEIEGCVGGEDGDQDRDRDQAEVVMTGYRCVTGYGCVTDQGCGVNVHCCTFCVLPDRLDLNTGAGGRV